jgi:hypothetical protein
MYQPDSWTESLSTPYTGDSRDSATHGSGQPKPPERPVIAATPWRVATHRFPGSIPIRFAASDVGMSSAVATTGQQVQAVEAMMGAGMLALTIHLTITFSIGWSNVTG